MEILPHINAIVLDIMLVELYQQDIKMIFLGLIVDTPLLLVLIIVVTVPNV